MKFEQRKQLEDIQKENARLKKLVIDLLLEKSMLEEALRDDYGSTNSRPLISQSKN
ncbi:MAG: hypothetical protein JW749_03920 [Sedimentisphaerales bacterium]|nr:hypothetical protein [Sedimentisphaerales bacterium]